MIMLRSVIKSATARAITWTRADKAAHVRLHREVPFTVSYHRVVERIDTSNRFALPSMEITAAMLERHLDWLSRNFRIVSLYDLANRKRTGSKPVACVTFDDGYSDVYHHAFPLLKRKGIPAGMFVVTDLVGSKALPIHDELHAALVANATPEPFPATRSMLQRLPQSEVLRFIDQLGGPAGIGETWREALQPMSWGMLAEMREAGMTIGSHTRTHAFLANESEERVREELDSSRRVLETRLGAAAQWLSYPGGSFNADVARAVIRAGYRYAFTDCHHRNAQYPLLSLPRKTMWEKSCVDPYGRFSPAIMSCHAAAMFEKFSDCAGTH